MPAATATPAPVLNPARATPVPTPTPTPAPDALTAAQGVYTIGWLSDTQHYSEAHPAIFRAMTRFLRDERARLALCYVVHTGDLVQDWDDSAQWDAAQDAMRALSKIPHGVLAGNHDVGYSKRDFSTFLLRFGGEAMAAQPWCGGVYRAGEGHYDLIDAGETRYVFAYIGSQPDAEAVAWLNGVFAAYPERVGVLCAHEYFRTNLEYNDYGELLRDGVVAASPNVYLVLCGHRYNVASVPLAFDDDGDGEAERTVYQMMANYQAVGDEGGSGYIRFLQIDEAAGEMRIYSYSPYLDDYRYGDTPGAQAEKYPVDPINEEVHLPLPWRLPAA